MENNNTPKNYVVLVTALCIAFAAIAFGMESLNTIKHPNGQVATITVSGEGEVTALPDIATVTMTVRESAKTVPEAQKVAEEKVSKVLASIATLGVDKKDVKTVSYTVNPQYESRPVVYNGYVPVPQVASTKIIGYEVLETVQIKVRKIDSAGDVIAAIGNANVAEISGPEFTVDDMDGSNAQAKEKAIADAKLKAKATARALGVSLGEVTSYSEDNGGYYPGYMSARSNYEDKAGVSVPTLPQGESVIKSRVTITYALD